MLSLGKHTRIRSLLLATVAAEREALARVASGPPDSQLLVLEKFDASILDQIPVVPVEKNLLLKLILTEELLTQLPLC